MSQDLIRSLPPGWSVQGLSAARFDGANWFRVMPGHMASFTVQSRTPSYVTFRYQTFSASSGYSFQLTQDGAEQRSEGIAKGDFHNAYVNLRLPAGTSRLRFDVDCPQDACLPLSLYFTNVQTVVQRASSALQIGEAVLLATFLIALLALWFRPFGRSGRRAPDPSAPPG